MTQIPVQPSPKISLGDIWQDTSRFLLSESRLLIPVAFATIFLGEMLFALANMSFGGPGLLSAPIMFVASICRLLGVLTITILALGDGISVREAFAVAWRRLPRLLAVLMLLVGALILLLTPTLPYVYRLMAFMAANNGKAPADPGAIFPAWISFYLLAWAVLFWWMIIRMLLVTPIVAAGQNGIIAVMKISHRLTDGLKWRLLGVILLFSVVNAVLVLTTQLVTTVAWKLVTRSTTLDASGVLFTSALVSAVSTMLVLIAISFVARLYRGLVAANQAM